MTAPKSLLNFENIIKLSTLIVVVLTNYYATKSDIRNLNTEKRFEITHIQYQLDELKDCCNDKQPKQIVMNRNEAILPNGLNFEDVKR
jgi:hypothetical protein